MFNRMLMMVSFGGWYRVMGGVYLALGAVSLLSLTDGVAVAQTAPVPCDPGFYDCGGTCVADDQICCPDGSSGSNSECYCCHGEGEDESLGTVHCGVPEGYEEEYEEFLELNGLNGVPEEYEEFLELNGLN